MLVIVKCQKLVCNMYDKRNYIVYIKALKLALDYVLILEKVHRVIKLNQGASLTRYININVELRKKADVDFKRKFFKLMYKSVFRKTMENLRNHRDITLELPSEPIYHKTKHLSKKLLEIEMNKLNV